MNLATAYTAAIRYGRVSDEELKPWVEAINKVPEFSGGSHPAQFLADYLQDQDDPRHVIVRHAMNYPTSSSMITAVENRLAQDLEVPTTAEAYNGCGPRLALENGVEVRRVSNAKGTTRYRLFWSGDKLKDEYQTVLTPDEMKQFLENSGSKHKIEDLH